MNFQEILNTQLGKTYRGGFIDGDIGLENEIEGQNLIPLNQHFRPPLIRRPRLAAINLRAQVDEPALPEPVKIVESKWWLSKPDGSLRDGIEYIFIKPVSLVNLKEALEEWKELTVKHKCKFQQSLRTSLHVHINATHLTYREIYCALVAYWLTENLLVKLHGQSREGNLFCLRAKDADFVIQQTINGLENNEYFQPLARDEYKYAACNVGALGVFGSLEFRFMRGTSDVNVMELWSTELYNLVHNAGNYVSPQQILDALRANPLTFLQTLFSESFVTRLISQDCDWVAELNDNFCALTELSGLFNRKLKSPRTGFIRSDPDIENFKKEKEKPDKEHITEWWNNLVHDAGGGGAGIPLARPAPGQWIMNDGIMNAVEAPPELEEPLDDIVMDDFVDPWILEDGEDGDGNDIL